MPTYVRRVQIPGKTSQQLYDTVSQEIDRLLAKASLGKYEVQCRPQQKEVYVKSSFFTATLMCSEEQMEVKAQLGFLAAAFQSKLDESISYWLTKTFHLA